MENQFAPQPFEQDMIHKARYPHPGELKRLSVKGKLGEVFYLIPTAARAFEYANEQFIKFYGRPIQVSFAYQRSMERRRYNYGHSSHGYGTALDVEEYRLVQPFLESVGFMLRNFINDPWHFDFVGPMDF